VLNGATAHLGKAGDLLTIMSFIEVEPKVASHWKPKVVVLGRGNSIVTERGI
jgi:aspartate 1-decarboxylase